MELFMNYKEKKINLFEIPKEYALGQCLSTDCDKKEGIVVQFNKKFKGMMNFLSKSNPNVGECILYQKNKDSQKVLNLFTKKKYFAKPTYDSFEKSILDMKRVCLENNIDKIAIPKIGSGKDKLNWAKNRDIIKKIFEDTEIEIIVCFK